MLNPIEKWKSEKHSFEVWNDLLKYAENQTPMSQIDKSDLERMKWYGYFYRKRDEPGLYMTRIRISGCLLNADQAKEIAHIAYEYGHGIVDVTTRGNIQVQGLKIENIPKVEQRLQNVGLTAKQTGHDNIRNVFGHPFSGLLPSEIIDTNELCQQVTDIFVDSRDFSDLPRKLNICLSGNDEHPSHLWTQDLSFLADHDKEGNVVFQVLIGGTQGQTPRLAWHLPVLVEPDQVVDITRAVIELFREKGSRGKRNRTRLRFLIEEIGIEGVLEYLAGKLPYQLRESNNEPIPSSKNEEMVGWFSQTQPDQWIMGLGIPLGRMTWDQLEGLAVLSKKWGDGQLRTTPEQGLAVVNIPTGFKEAAATDAAALRLTIHTDPFIRNTMACTGSQFCNIGVTETKGHMFQLIEKLRQRALTLHGIRIHMSGCPSSCAQHFTADIGLKGVRVRRLLGTREGFDVYLGGGISGQVHMGLPYKLGVDVDQLPQMVEEVVNEYYLKHKSGQTFSSYWREKLKEKEADKALEEEYQYPLWICEGCNHEYLGEDPPVYCPSCAGLRRLFARVENNGDADTESIEETVTEEIPVREDGFVFAAKLEKIKEGEGFCVEIEGNEIGLYSINGKIHAVDNLCPHEGASLSDGEVKGNVIVCPLHEWTFDACTGCSLDPTGNDLKQYEVLLEDDNVFVKQGDAPPDKPSTGEKARKSTSKIKTETAELTLKEVIEQTPDTRTFRFDNSSRMIPQWLPGQFARIAIPLEEGEVWRSFTISSSPTERDYIDLTIKLNPGGIVSPYLFDKVRVGDSITMKAPMGMYYFDSEQHQEPLVLVAAGSGVTPMMSILQYLEQTNPDYPCTLIYGARKCEDIIFNEQFKSMSNSMKNFRYFASLSQPDEHWLGLTGRICSEKVSDLATEPETSRYFLCGPDMFMEEIQKGLSLSHVSPDRIHTEQFHTKVATVSS